MSTTKQSDEFEHWKTNGPWVFQDSERNREWVFAEPARYYLYEKEGEWVVIDRFSDFRTGVGHKSREAAIRAFYKAHGRKVPTGTTLPKFKGSNFSG